MCESGISAIDFSGEYEIALRQAIDLMRKDGDFGLAPCEKNVGMMGLFFRDGPGAIDELERFFEIGEAKPFVEMMLVDHFPAGQLFLQRIERFAFESGDSAPARHTRLFRQWLVG
jgi:hypothetical protein